MLIAIWAMLHLVLWFLIIEIMDEAEASIPIAGFVGQLYAVFSMTILSAVAQ